MDLEKPIKTSLKKGDEPFRLDDQPKDFILLDFWRWNTSDLVSNATRGRLAEFIIARALGINTEVVRDEWGAYDLETADGIKIQVKSSARIQSWAQRKLSDPIFPIKKTLSWDAETNKQAKEKTREADVYIFALLAHENKATVDPLNLDQWIFYVLTTEEINNYERSQHSITRKSLEKLTQPVSYSDLNAAFRTKWAAHSSHGA